MAAHRDPGAPRGLVALKAHNRQGRADAERQIAGTGGEDRFTWLPMGVATLVPA